MSRHSPPMPPRSEPKAKRRHQDRLEKHTNGDSGDVALHVHKTGVRGRETYERGDPHKAGHIISRLDACPCMCGVPFPIPMFSLLCVPSRLASPALAKRKRQDQGQATRGLIQQPTNPAARVSTTWIVECKVHGSNVDNFYLDDRQKKRQETETKHLPRDYLNPPLTARRYSKGVLKA